MPHLKIGYFADGPWSHQALTKLLSDNTIQIAFICARHDTPDPVLKAEAEKHGILFITHPDINSQSFLRHIGEYKCDLFVSMSFNQIFRTESINLPTRKTINCHAGKLPFYRGRNILNWALINDEREFGITVHFVDEGIDTGDIIMQRCYPISDNDDYSTLLTRAYEGCAVNLYDAIKAIQNDNVSRVPQVSIHRSGFYCSARKAGDERLNWDQSSRDVFNFVRAICRPGPEARTWISDSELKINRVEYLPDAPHYKGIPGAVVGLNNETFLVKTSDSYVRVAEWSASTRPRLGDRLS